jgi:isopentenyl-diphosphate delta-isomerase
MSTHSSFASHPAPERESHLVELVDLDGRPAGAMTVHGAHQEPGALHRAFSVFLRDAEGRVLLQQRAAVKTRFPLRWGNTCCGHPAPGEAVATAAGRRLAEELSVRDVELTELGTFTYWAADPVTGRVEHEYDHVLLGELPEGVVPEPDPDEIAELRWVSVRSLQTGLVGAPESYAPWLAGVFEILLEHLADPERPSEESSEGPGGR